MFPCQKKTPYVAGKKSLIATSCTSAAPVCLTLDEQRGSSEVVSSEVYVVLFL